MSVVVRGTPKSKSGDDHDVVLEPMVTWGSSIFRNLQLQVIQFQWTSEVWGLFFILAVGDAPIMNSDSLMLLSPWSPWIPCHGFTIPMNSLVNQGASATISSKACPADGTPGDHASGERAAGHGAGEHWAAHSGRTTRRWISLTDLDDHS